MISIKDARKTYDGRTLAVDGLTLNVGPGVIFGFIGPNGAGKTTTIRMITGSVPPDGGIITVNGRDITLEPVEAKRQFGFVPDAPCAFLSFTGEEYLNFMADAYEVGSVERRDNILSLAGRFAMLDSLARPIREYSHGMKQKISIIGSLIHDPHAWILDEPLTGLDPESAHELKIVMREKTARGHTVFFSTHALDAAERLCDRLGIIMHGKLRFSGTFEELRAAAAVREKAGAAGGANEAAAAVPGPPAVGATPGRISGEPAAGETLEHIFMELMSGEKNTPRT